MLSLSLNNVPSCHHRIKQQQLTGMTLHRYWILERDPTGRQSDTLHKRPPFTNRERADGSDVALNRRHSIPALYNISLLDCCYWNPSSVDCLCCWSPHQSVCEGDSNFLGLVLVTVRVAQIKDTHHKASSFIRIECLMVSVVIPEENHQQRI